MDFTAKVNQACSPQLFEIDYFDCATGQPTVETSTPLVTITLTTGHHFTATIIDAHTISIVPRNENWPAGNYVVGKFRVELPDEDKCEVDPPLEEEVRLKVTRGKLKISRKA